MGAIALRAPDAEALFDPIDPAPLPGRALDAEVARYISERWAEARGARRTVDRLEIHLDGGSAGMESAALAAALRHAFTRNEDRSRREFRTLMKEGHRGLVVTVVFLVLVAIVFVAFWPSLKDVPFPVASAATVALWAVYWRPVEIFVYDWRPIRARTRQWQTLAGLPIEVHRPP